MYALTHAYTFVNAFPPAYTCVQHERMHARASMHNRMRIRECTHAHMHIRMRKRPLVGDVVPPLLRDDRRTYRPLGTVFRGRTAVPPSCWPSLLRRFFDSVGRIAPLLLHLSSPRPVRQRQLRHCPSARRWCHRHLGVTQAGWAGVRQPHCTLPLGPDLSAKLNANIWENEFIELNKLLHICPFEPYNVFVCSGDSNQIVSVLPHTKERHSSTFNQWTSALGQSIGKDSRKPHKDILSTTRLCVILLPQVRHLPDGNMTPKSGHSGGRFPLWSYVVMTKQKLNL